VNRHRAVLFVLLTTLLLAGCDLEITKKQAQKAKGSPSIPPKVQPRLVSESPQGAVVVYGVRESNSVFIQVADLEGHTGLVTQLPTNIKDVHVLSPTELLYINQTDEKDHGREIVKYDLNTRQVEILAKAQEGWGIDDYILSPDNSWIAWWEVQFQPGNNKLLGGKSRVYTKQVNSPSATYTITDETATTDDPILYPLFFDRHNNLFLDSFIPNGGGFYLGLYSTLPQVPLPNDETLADSLRLPQDRFNSDPILSPTGNKILFTAPSPTGIAQTQAIARIKTAARGIGRASTLSYDWVVVYDLDLNDYEIVLDGGGTTQFGIPIWIDNNNIAVQKFTRSDQSTSYAGAVRLELTTKTERALSEFADPTAVPLTYLADYFIYGLPTNNYDNLGENYLPILSSIGRVTPNALLASGFVQFVGTITPPAGQVAIKSTPLGHLSSLQLKGLVINTTVVNRPAQQNDTSDISSDTRVRCRDYYKQLKEELGETEIGGYASVAQEGIRAGKCYDSPLYLYPETKTEVTIEPLPAGEVLASSPQLHHFWKVVAYPTGKLQTPDGRTLDKIAYAYSAPQIEAPTEGIVVAQRDLEKALLSYALRVGLQGREVTDFKKLWLEELPPASFYFISHFSDKDAKKIMSFAIDPEPDSFIQVVMYFKPLDELQGAVPPKFGPVPQRSGFTAVDWSGVIDSSK
jgi:hypothetical protein